MCQIAEKSRDKSIVFYKKIVQEILVANHYFQTVDGRKSHPEVSFKPYEFRS